MDCIFCKIIDGEIPSNKVYEDEHVVCFHDIAPQAPIHILIVPKKHIPSIIESCTDDKILYHMACAIKVITQDLGISESGFRTICNTGIDGGQSIDHLHFHLLAGKTMTESII